MVLPKAEIVAVKVLRSNGSGTMSDVVKGVEYAAKSHQEAVKSSKKGFKGSTANMSLGGGKSPALDLAVNAAVKAGLHLLLLLVMKIKMLVIHLQLVLNWPLLLVPRLFLMLELIFPIMVNVLIFSPLV